MGRISEYQNAKEGDGILYHPIKECCIYLQKNDRYFNVRAGCGIHLSPRPLLAGILGDGLYLRMGSSVYDGKGLLLGPHTPFRNLPILKWILWNKRAIYFQQREERCTVNPPTKLTKPSGCIFIVIDI